VPEHEWRLNCDRAFAAATPDPGALAHEGHSERVQSKYAGHNHGPVISKSSQFEFIFMKGAERSCVIVNGLNIS
jgi:hypothetical protein